jgi:hypothetical protein
MAKAIDKFLDSDIGKQNGLMSRADFVNRLIAAFFANFQKDFGLFVPKVSPLSPLQKISPDSFKLQKHITVIPAQDIIELLSVGALNKNDVVERKNLILKLKEKGFLEESEAARNVIEARDDYLKTSDQQEIKEEEEK